MNYFNMLYDLLDKITRPLPGVGFTLEECRSATGVGGKKKRKIIFYDYPITIRSEIPSDTNNFPKVEIPKSLNLTKIGENYKEFGSVKVLEEKYNTFRVDFEASRKLHAELGIYM